MFITIVGDIYATSEKNKGTCSVQNYTGIIYAIYMLYWLHSISAVMSDLSSC